MTPIRVVLVDDHAILRQGIRALLDSDPEIQVVGEAADGEEALGLVERLGPDVAVMDIGMPRLNGIEATRIISARWPGCRVLILTMHDNPEYVRPVLGAGAAGYVLKRSVVQDLVAAIKSVHRAQTVLDPGLARALLGSEGPPTEDRSGGGAQDAGIARGGTSAVGSSGGADGGHADPLTEREREVLVLVARGLSNQEIADRLVISIKTVQAHRANIMQKLDLHDAVDLTKYALRRGLLRLDEP